MAFYKEDQPLLCSEGAGGPSEKEKEKEFRKLVTEVIGVGLTYYAVERSGLKITIHKDFVLRRETSCVSGKENSIHSEKVWIIKILEVLDSFGCGAGEGVVIASDHGQNSKENLAVIARRIAPFLYEKDPRIGWRKLGPPCPLFDNDHFPSSSCGAGEEAWWGGGIVGWVTN